MKKILVTGASGFLGWQVCRKVLRDWEMIGTWHGSKSSIPKSTQHYQIDLRDKDAVWQMLKETKPTSLFHLAAISGTSACETEPQKAMKVNVDSTIQLAEMCAERKVKFVFTSSEQVFDGALGNYTETDLPKPRNEYGKQKLQAEKLLLEMGFEPAIVRLSVMFGKGSHSSECFLEQWLHNWLSLLPVTTFHDEKRSFLSGENAAEGLIHLLKQDARGIFHLGGSEAVSRTEFAELATSIYQLPKARIKSISQQEVEVKAYRPPNLSLNISKIQGTGFQPSSLSEELEKLKGVFDLSPKIGLN